MSTPTDPLMAVSPALGSLGRAPGLPEGLTGEPGVALIEWLLEDGVTPAHFSDAEASFRAYAQASPGSTPEQLRNDLTTIAYLRQFQEMPRLMTFLQDAIARLESPAQAQALADYMAWLARRAAVMAP
jgi:hypothetical protein